MEKRRRVALGPETPIIVRFVQGEQRTVVPQDILVHPCCGKETLHFLRDDLPLIFVCKGEELVRNDGRYPKPAPVRADVTLIGIVLLPNEVKANLLGDLRHFLRMLFLDGLQGAGDGVGAAPGLDPNRAFVGIIQQDLDDVL